VPDDTLLSDLLFDWLYAAWQAHPRRSKRAVALRLGLPVPTVNRILRRERDANVQVDTIGRIVRKTGYTAAYIWDCIEQRRPLPQITVVRKATPKQGKKAAEGG
jgi:hypothetical protein